MPQVQEERPLCTQPIMETEHESTSATNTVLLPYWLKTRGPGSRNPEKRSRLTTR